MLISSAQSSAQLYYDLFRRRWPKHTPSFLERYARITLNGHTVKGQPISIGQSKLVEPARHMHEVDGVDVRIITGLLSREDWSADRAGWYILCNGRVIVFAEKTSLTGWGVDAFPIFHPKFRGFVGVVFFFSGDPGKLPWTTTKRGLDRESRVFQAIRPKMLAQARPVMSFLNRMSSGEEPEEPVEREIAESLRRSTTVFKNWASSEFVARPSTRNPPNTVSVQFRAKRADIERVRRSLEKPNWSAKDVGEYALSYLIENEVAQ